MTWGAFFRCMPTDSLPQGWTLDGITQEMAVNGWWKILQRHLFCLDGSDIFKNTPLAKAHVSLNLCKYLRFFFSMWTWKQRRGKNVATCMFSTSHFQVLGFFRHENQASRFPEILGASRLFSLFRIAYRKS